MHISASRATKFLHAHCGPSASKETCRDQVQSLHGKVSLCFALNARVASTYRNHHEQHETELR